MTATPARYLMALGSNVPHPRHGPPPRALRAALAAMTAAGLTVIAASPIIASAPVGPSRRRYANGAALVESPLSPPALLALLQGIEAAFGRNRRGQRWCARTLDLDIVLWSGGIWRTRTLTIPHPRYRIRDFVLGPAAQIAPGWRDPETGLTLAHQRARLTRRARLPKAPVHSATAPGP